MQYWKGIRLDCAANIDRKWRIHFFAHKLGWHRKDEGFRYYNYRYALDSAALDYQDAYQLLNSNDECLYNFLFNFRAIELQFEIKNRETEKRNNFYCFSRVLPLCLITDGTSIKKKGFIGFEKGFDALEAFLQSEYEVNLIKSIKI
jgi:hypothetical protein